MYKIISTLIETYRSGETKIIWNSSHMNIFFFQSFKYFFTKKGYPWFSALEENIILTNR